MLFFVSCYLVSTTSLESVGSDISVLVLKYLDAKYFVDVIKNFPLCWHLDIIAISIYKADSL